MEKTRSQMLAVPAQFSDIEEPQALLERLREAEDFEVKFEEMEKETIRLVIVLKEETFLVEMYPMDFTLPELYRCQHLFPDVDVEAIQRAQYGLAIEMDFGIDALASYHLQLKLIHTMLPDVLAVIDDSSEKILSGRWVALAAQSKVPPAPRYLYTAQAVSGDEDTCVWLHTHGLKRCGRPELEVLNSTRDNYQEHYNVLETLANRILEDEGLIQSRAGARSFVSLDEARAAAVRRALLAEGAAELVARLKAMGLDRDEALELIGTLWEEAEG